MPHLSSQESELVEQGGREELSTETRLRERKVIQQSSGRKE